MDAKNRSWDEKTPELGVHCLDTVSCSLSVAYTPSSLAVSTYLRMSSQILTDSLSATSARLAARGREGGNRDGKGL